MSLVTRFHGFSLTPTFVQNGPSSPVSVAIDDSRLTLWVGDPVSVWQTPLAELHHLEATVGRYIIIRFTIAEVRYRLRARRRAEHGDLLELIRASGGRVARSTRARAVGIISVAAVLLIASLASIVSVFDSSSVPSTSDLAAINLQRSDLPPGYGVIGGDYLDDLKGAANDIQTSSTTSPPLTGRNLRLFNAVSSNFFRCMHVSKRNDRFYGSAGVMPQLQVSGATYRSSANGGIEIGSAIQYYRTTQMVSDDLVEYSSPRFGPCFAQQSAQLLLAYSNHKVSAANTAVPTANDSPATFSHGWRRGGTAVINLPGVATPFTVVSILAARGHDEVALYALVANYSPTTSAPIIASALNAILARLDPATVSGSA